MEVEYVEMTNGVGGTVARYAVDTEAFDAWWETPHVLTPGVTRWFRVENNDFMDTLDAMADRDREFSQRLANIR